MNYMLKHIIKVLLPNCIYLHIKLDYKIFSKSFYPSYQIRVETENIQTNF